MELGYGEKQSKSGVIVLLIGLVLFSTAGFGCGGELRSGEELREGKVSIDELERLRLGMTFEEVYRVLGLPLDYVGSGVMSLKYGLKEGGCAYVEPDEDFLVGEVWIVDSAGNERVLLGGQP